MLWYCIIAHDTNELFWTLDGDIADWLFTRLEEQKRDPEFGSVGG